MSKTSIEPYLFFGGQCEEALEFYKKAIGAEIEMMMRFDESPEPAPEGMLPPGAEKKIMHASFRIGGAVVMASDGCGPKEPISGFGLAVDVEKEEDVDRFINALADGGEVTMAPGKTFWSPRFGSVKDRFGVSWMIGVDQQ